MEQPDALEIVRAQRTSAEPLVCAARALVRHSIVRLSIVRLPLAQLAGAPLLAVLLLACTTPANPALAPQPSRQRVVDLRWEGVTALRTEDLRGVVRTEAAPELKVWERARLPAEDVLNSDVERIEALYRQRGYYRAHARYRVERRPSSPRVEVVFSVDEGPPVLVAERAIRFSAPDPDQVFEERESLVQDLPLPPGSIFDIELYRSAKDELLRRLAQRGYLGAKLKGGADVDPKSSTAHIDWTVETGPIVLQGPIDVTGLERVDADLVRRTLRSEPGAPLSPQWLQDGQKRLLELGLFRWAVVQPVQPEEEGTSAREQWPIAVRLSERPPRSVSLALGYGTEEKARARASWEHRNLLGRGRTLRFGGQYSALESNLSAGVDWRELLPGVRGEVTAEARGKTQEAFDARELELRSGLEHRSRNGWLTRFGHRFELSRTLSVSDSAEEVLDNPEQTYRLSLLELSGERSVLDVPGNPRRGYSVRLGGELSAKAFGSQVNFARSSLDLRGYRPLGSTVLAGRLQLGSLLPYSHSSGAEIPLTERFFAGGGDSVRGFEYQQLGPLDAEGKPLGGTSLVAASAELRVPIAGRFGGVVFLDAGQVELEPLRFGFDDLRYSAGLGLRFDTPVGPVRVDYGYPLNGERGGVNRGRFHLSVGHAF